MTSTSYPGYKIVHVGLDQSLAAPTAAPAMQGNYLVFWWKDIALGSLFVEANQTVTEAEYMPLLLSVIEPAIRHYAAKHSAGSEPWTTWLLARDADRWHSWMDAVFAGWLPTNVPTQLPVSIIICTRNRAEQLAVCLRQMRTLRSQPAEIVVVDNAPTDSSTEKVVRKFPEAVYVREPRAGLDIARNTGIVAAQNEIIIFIDDDVMVNDMLVYWTWQAFEEPAVAAMTGLVIAHSLQTEAQVIFEKNWSFNRGYIDTYYTPDYLNQTGPPVWKIGAGANMAFRKSIFEQAGYFDELLDAGAAGCSGDSEMWHRILANGGTIHYNPRAVAHHAHREQLQDLKDQIFYYMRGHVVAALIQHRHRPQDGYDRYLKRLYNYYSDLLGKHFPLFRYCHPTMWAEIKGAAAGVAYYYRHRDAA